MFSPPKHGAYLRGKAARFRELAAALNDSISSELLALASEMEASATEIERASAPHADSASQSERHGSFIGRLRHPMDERRLIYRVLRHWTEMAIAQRYPTMDNIDPWLIGDDWANCTMLKLSGDKERSTFVVVGKNLVPPGLSLDGASIARCPRETVLADLVKHLDACAADGAPVIIDGSAEHLGATVQYRGILLPLSSNGQSVDAIFSAANFRKMVR